MSVCHHSEQEPFDQKIRDGMVTHFVEVTEYGNVFIAMEAEFAVSEGLKVKFLHALIRFSSQR